MVFVSELFSLCVYIVQQLGIVLAVGAQTVLLAAYLLNIHSDKDEHASLMHASKYVLGLGLMAIAASGTGAVAFHLLLGQFDVLLSPAFIFKWILILAAVTVYIWDDTLVNQPPLAQASARGLAGALWYGMLLVHLVAPVIEWMPLLLLFMSWALVFMALWGIFVGVMHWSAPLARAARAERAKVKAEQRAIARAHADEEARMVAQGKIKHQEELEHQAEVAAKKKEEEKKQQQQQEQKKAQEAQVAAAQVAAKESAQKAAQEAKRVAEEEAKRKADEEAKRKAEEEAKKAADVPHAPLPVVVPLELTAPHVEVKPPPPPVPVPPPPPPKPPAPPAPTTPPVPPAPEPSSLPTIRVMPRTIEDLAKHQ